VPIEAYIQPFMLSKVLRELHTAHVRGLTVFDVKGFGREKDESYPHHASEYAVDFTPKVKLELLCLDEEVETVVAAIVRAARTGRKGDGKIFVTTLDGIQSIRTEEAGEGAI